MKYSANRILSWASWLLAVVPPAFGVKLQDGTLGQVLIMMMAVLFALWEIADGLEARHGKA